MKSIVYLFTAVLFLISPLTLYADEILFDTSHHVIFHPQSDKPLGLKKFVALFEGKNHKVSINDTLLTKKKLEGVSTLILPGSMTSYNLQEQKMIETFVSEGGSLLVLLHIAPPLARVAELFGIILSNMVISEKVNIIDNSSQDFFVKDIKPHRVTRGVNEIALYGTWGLLAEGNAKVVAFTSDQAWGDLNRNRHLDAGEPIMKVGVVAISEHGKGKVVVVADDAPLANTFLTMGDNMILAKNIIAWLTEK